MLRPKAVLRYVYQGNERKAILDFQTARHQNGIAVKLNGKYPYDDGIESSWERKKDY